MTDTINKQEPTVELIGCLTADDTQELLNDMSNDLIIATIDFMGGSEFFINTYQQINTSGSIGTVDNLENVDSISSFFYKNRSCIVEWLACSQGHDLNSIADQINKMIDPTTERYEIDVMDWVLFDSDNQDYLTQDMIEVQRSCIALIINAMCNAYLVLTKTI